MIAFVSLTDVRVAGIVFLVVGVLALVGIKRNADAWWLAGIGAAMSTWGLILVYCSFDKHIDGPSG